MKVAREALEDVLNRLIEIYSSKIHLKDTGKKYFINKNLSGAKATRILNKDIPLQALPDIELYYLTRIFLLAKSSTTGESVITDEDRREIQSDKYFTPLEMERADLFKAEIPIIDVDYLYIEDVKKTSDYCYLTVMSYKELVDLMNGGWVGYDFETQREANLKIDNRGKIIRSAKLYPEAVAQIKEAIIEGNYTPNLITLNITRKENNDKFKFVNNNKFEIPRGTEISIIDGFHRNVGTLRAYEKKPDIKGVWYVSILNYTIEEAQQYIEREDRRNAIDKKHLIKYRKEKPSIVIAQRLNTTGNKIDNSMFNKLTTNEIEFIEGKYTLFETIAMALEHTFQYEKPFDITVLVPKYLIHGFNYIIGMLDQFRDKTKNDLATHPNMFAFYTVFLYSLYPLYNKNKDEWENKFMNQLANFDFSKENKLWKQLGILNKKINKSSIQKMKKYLIEERKLVMADGK